jgi:hypothetical protein
VTFDVKVGKPAAVGGAKQISGVREFDQPVALF